MPAALLDINDSNLQLWHGDLHLQSPGYALLQGREYRFGHAARGAARLQPRDINTRFWWQLGTAALQPPMGSARHTADLVHAHLQALYAQAGQPGKIVLAVSGSMQRDQLSLLLGIVQQCPFDAAGLVNRSVALGSLVGGSGRLFHLELQLHQAVLSELDRRGGSVELVRAVPLPGFGLLQLQERLVEVIAAAFIRQTRFDPRRKAATEQQLYDALPDLLRALAHSAETNAEVNGYRARLAASELTGAGRDLSRSAAEIAGPLGPGDVVLADPLAELLPGLAECLPGLQLQDPGALREAVARHGELLLQEGEALSLVTTLPCIGPVPARAVSAPRPALHAPEPTHLLRGARAMPLEAAGTPVANGWSLSRDAAGWRLTGAGPHPEVNGAGYRDDRPLACGDRIRIPPDEEFLLIEVS